MVVVAVTVQPQRGDYAFGAKRHNPGSSPEIKDPKEMIGRGTIRVKDGGAKWRWGWGRAFYWRANPTGKWRWGKGQQPPQESFLLI